MMMRSCCTSSTPSWVSVVLLMVMTGTVRAWSPMKTPLSRKRPSPIPKSGSRANLPSIFQLASTESSSTENHHHDRIATANTDTFFPSGSTVCLTDPVTGCEVVLLGCFHGARSSADDVTQCLQQSSNKNNGNSPNDPSVVVALELCATRFADLRRDVQRDIQQQQQTLSSTSQAQNSASMNDSDNQESTDTTTDTSDSTLLIMSEDEERPWLVRFQEMVSQTVQQRGWSTGLAAALLGGVSGMQTALSGLEPGLEFRTALEYAMMMRRNDDNVDEETVVRDVPIVLADQNVDETLEKIGRIPSEAVALWKEFLSNPIDNWARTFGVEAIALGKAVGLLDPSPSPTSSSSLQQQKVTLGGFATRSPKAIRDLVRLMLPPVLTLQASVLAVNLGFEWLRSQPEWMDAAAAQQQAAMATADLSAGGSAVSAWSNVIIFTSLYMSLALPAVKVILRERDDILARNIRQACELAIANNNPNSDQQQQGPRGRVVAVLGLLHVNGVAERLLQETTTPSSAQSQALN